MRTRHLFNIDSHMKYHCNCNFIHFKITHNTTNSLFSQKKSREERKRDILAGFSRNTAVNFVRIGFAAIAATAAIHF